MIELIREDNEYAVYRVSASLFTLGKSNEMIWLPSIIQVVRKVSVTNTRTGITYPIGSKFYLDTDCSPRYTAEQVSSLNYAVQYINGGKKAALSIARAYNPNGILKDRVYPYAYHYSKSDNNPHGKYDKRFLAQMGCSDYWSNIDNVKRMQYKKVVLCGDIGKVTTERDNSKGSGEIDYFIKYRNQEEVKTKLAGKGKEVSITLVNGTLPLVALDWQRLEAFYFRVYVSESADWNISSRGESWFTNYYDESDFLSMGIRIK